MMIRVLSLVALVGALACVAGCEGSPSGRCDSIYSKLEQQPEFKSSGMSRYGNEFRAAFTEACAKLPEPALKCLEAAQKAEDFGKCEVGDVFEQALSKVGQPK